MQINFEEMEKKWQKRREEEHIYETKEDPSKEKFYILDMFPYPSGAGLHVGHPKGYLASDVLSRKKILEGYSVLHPMGFDTFGLGTENHAIQNKTKPQLISVKNINYYKEQLRKIGFTYDWGRTFSTADPEYYKWTQWIFLQFYNHYYDEEQQKARPIEELEKRLKSEWIEGEELTKRLNAERLAFVDYKPINRCPNCKTGLANEDLDDGKCERCASEVEQRPMKQWVLRITKYADRLLNDLDGLDWDESMKELERNWIGKSEGTQFQMKIDGNESDFFEVFTTRIDTVFGMTFVVMAPEHPLVDKITTAEYKDAVEKYKEQAKFKTQLERTELQKEKTGQFTGAYAINPFNGEKVPVYIGDYVLANYGTWVVMAVPAHDERDFEFAKKHGLPIKSSVCPKNASIGEFPTLSCKYEWNQSKIDILDWNKFKCLRLPDMCGGNSTCCIKTQKIEDLLDLWITWDFTIFHNPSWIVINCWDFFIKNRDLVTKVFKKKYNQDSDEFVNDLVENFLQEPLTELAILVFQEWLKDQKIWMIKNNYKIQDWVFSRQRYWGEPFPIVYCEKCGIVPLKESDLPVLLPDVDNYEPTGREEGPLADIDEWMNTTCPICGGKARRESNTMPGRAGSSWYWLRFMDPRNDHEFLSPEKERYWKNVDVYVWGAEHVTRHMIYARFRQKFLYDLGLVQEKEPFQRYEKVGLIMAEDGRKMSKRRGNVINPDDVIAEYGADAFRTYEMFMGPFSQYISWNTNGLRWTRKFIDKVIALRDKIDEHATLTPELECLLHQTIKKTTEDIDNFRFNTTIAQFMILVNALTELEKIPTSTFETFIVLLAPFAPHLAEEFWEKLGHEFSIFNKATRPKYDESKIQLDEIDLTVQFNGRTRGTVKVSPEATQEEVVEALRKQEKLEGYYTSGEIVKVIYIQGKIINIVVK